MKKKEDYKCGKCGNKGNLTYSEENDDFFCEECMDYFDSQFEAKMDDPFKEFKEFIGDD